MEYVTFLCKTYTVYNLEYFLHIKIQFLQTDTLDVSRLFLSLSLRRGESICCFVQAIRDRLLASYEAPLSAFAH